MQCGNDADARYANEPPVSGSEVTAGGEHTDVCRQAGATAGEHGYEILSVYRALFAHESDNSET
jgi:hypothetical protein